MDWIILESKTFHRQNSRIIDWLDWILKAHFMGFPKSLFAFPYILLLLFLLPGWVPFCFSVYPSLSLSPSILESACQSRFPPPSLGQPPSLSFDRRPNLTSFHENVQIDQGAKKYKTEKFTASVGVAVGNYQISRNLVEHNIILYSSRNSYSERRFGRNTPKRLNRMDFSE